MKHHDKTISHYAVLIVAAALCAATVGCRTSRKASEETTTHTDATISSRTESEVDTSFMASASRTEERDTATIATRDNGSITISRDSAGRPVLISWTHAGAVSSVAARNTLAESFFHGVDASAHTEVTADVDTVTEKKEKATAEIDAGISLKSLAGNGVLLLFALYWGYILLTEKILPWIKQQRDQ